MAIDKAIRAASAEDLRLALARVVATREVSGREARVHSTTVFPWGIPRSHVFRVSVEEGSDELTFFTKAAGHQG